jgi:hypothetical protein
VAIQKFLLNQCTGLPRCARNDGYIELISVSRRAGALPMLDARFIPRFIINRLCQQIIRRAGR